MNDRNQDESPIRAGFAAPPAVPVTCTTADDRMLNSPAAENRAPAAENELVSRLQSRVAVLAMLFIATGALGIPLLWINKKFSTAERVFWSITLLIYTVGVLLLGYVIIAWMWNRTMGAIYY